MNSASKQNAAEQRSPNTQTSTAQRSRRRRVDLVASLPCRHRDNRHRTSHSARLDYVGSVWRGEMLAHPACTEGLKREMAD